MILFTNSTSNHKLNLKTNRLKYPHLVIFGKPKDFNSNKLLTFPLEKTTP